MRAPIDATPCMRIVAVLLIAFLNSGAVLAQSATSDAYRLAPSDVIAISVLEDPELDRQVLVLPDGRVSMPIAGTLVAAGRTPDELSRTIRSRLRTSFVEPPTVTVAVISLGDEDEEDEAEVFVLGEVVRPGRYEYEADTPITVLKALSLAGGIGPFAARARIQVRETVQGTETLRLFDYDAVEDGQINTARDLAPLPSGAVIVVPERGLFE